MRYVAAVKPDRFRILTNLLKQQVNNTGDSSWAWNEAGGEVAVYHKSRDKSIGEKFACPTALLRYPTKCAGMRYQIYDEYKAVFCGCDIFNRQLHNRMFPYALPRDTSTAVERNDLSSVLINT